MYPTSPIKANDAHSFQSPHSRRFSSAPPACSYFNFRKSTALAFGTVLQRGKWVRHSSFPLTLKSASHRCGSTPGKKIESANPRTRLSVETHCERQYAKLSFALSSRTFTKLSRKWGSA